MVYLSSGTNDTDVNLFRFNKQQGLFINGPGKSIFYQLKKQQRMREITEMIMKRECNMICMPWHPVNEGITVMKILRFVKMIRKGWNIKNMCDKIKIHREDHDDVCNICFSKKLENTWVELTCSSCYLCLDCFEQFVCFEIRTRRGIFKCPTCRKELSLWR